MLLFRGLGFLAALIPFGCGIIAQLILGKVPFNAGIGYIIGGFLIFILGRRLNRVYRENSNESKRLLRKIDASHSLFFIRMEYWGILIFIFALGIMVPNGEFIQHKLVQIIAAFVLIGFAVFLYEKYILKLDDESIVQEEEVFEKRSIEKNKIETNLKKSKLKRSDKKVNSEFVQSMKELKLKPKEEIKVDHSRYMPPKIDKG